MKETGGILVLFGGLVLLMAGFNGTVKNVWQAIWKGASDGGGDGTVLVPPSQPPGEPGTSQIPAPPGNIPHAVPLLVPPINVPGAGQIF